MLIWLTICTFANTEGGKLLIGVDDKGNFIGVKSSKIAFKRLPFAKEEDDPVKFIQKLNLLTNGNHYSKPRNELLADIFFKAGLIEAWGRGTIKITDGCNNAGLLEPEFKEEFGGFVVYFFKDIYTEDILKKTGLNERQIIAVKYIKKHGTIKRRIQLIPTYGSKIYQMS